MGTQTELVITITEKAPEHKKERKSADKRKRKAKRHNKHGHQARQYRRIKPAHPEPTETKKRSGPVHGATKHHKREA